MMTGFLTYLRIYSGSLKARDNLLNTGSALLSGTPSGAKLNRSQRLKSLSQFPKERAMRLVEVFGSDMADIEEVGSGNICAALGLKNVKTGDTLIHAQQATQGEGESVLALAGIDTPEPVFFCSIEAESQSEQAKLDEALKCIMQEDPSVSLTSDVDTGQTLLRGMGELHLEIVHRRLVDDFKCKITMGSVRVAYRETIDGEFQHEASIDRVVAGRAAFAKVNLVVKPGELGSGIVFTFSETVQPPLAEGEVEADEDDNPELLKQKRKAERLNKGKRSDDGGSSSSPNDDDEAGDAENSSMTLKAIREAIVLGAEAALSRGTLLNYPMTDVVVHFESVEQNSNSTAPAFRQAASQAISQSLRVLKTSSAVSLLEPVMAADLSVQHAHVPLVLNDLVDRRRATIGDVINRGSDVGQPSLIHALVPLSEMIGYASAIRSLTQGNASFTMRFAEYQKVQAHHLKKLLANPPA
jgi:elongation factor G